MKTFTHRKGDCYLITGTDCNGDKFRMRTSNPWQALGINLLNGNVWQLTPPDKGSKSKRWKRRLIKRVRN